MNIYAYDIETYPNIFTCAIEHIATGTDWMFEISDRRDDTLSFKSFIADLQKCGAQMVGFNNVGFDYPVIHAILTGACITVADIYNKAMAIIKGDSFAHAVWPDDRAVTQIDLFKIHHFDNKARSTSLKALEFAMRMDDIQDLPFPVGVALNDEQKDVLISYNWHDIKATVEFYELTLHMIQFREVLSKRYNRDFTNHNDTKIGKDFFVMELERKGIECFSRVGGKKQPKQTLRPSIHLKDLIFNYVEFVNPEFNRILDYFKGKTITETKGVFNDLTATIDGLDYVFGAGGLHASVDRQLVVSNETHTVIDVDVASYYPNLAIQNGMYPKHLGREFCDIYLDVYQQRKTHAKGTPENESLKLALNGVYGDSNNKYSPFYDPAYTMMTTINGQLLLCMLVEELLRIPGMEIIQCNTDGVTYRCPNARIAQSRVICKKWEQLTQLELEEAQYSRFWIRDVNNYIAEYAGSGDLKRKGAYEYDREHHQNQSAMVVAKAVEQHMVHGVDVREFITCHTNAYDFCLRAKVPRSNRLVLRWAQWGVDMPQQTLTRYHVAKQGGSLVKIAPSRGVVGHYKRANKLTDSYYNEVLQTIGVGVWDERIHTKNKAKYEGDVETGISTGHSVAECNRMSAFDWNNLNYEYYINEANKLIIK